MSNLKQKLNIGLNWLKAKAKEFWKIVVGLIVGGALVSSIGAVDISGTKEVQIAGEKAEYVFECNGVRISEFATAEDYNSRFLKGGSGELPLKEGCFYRGGRRFYIYNTPNENLNEGQYVRNIESGIDRYYIQLPEGKFLNLSLEEVNLIKTIK